MMFSKNMGGLDRGLRFLLGVLLIAGALMGYGVWMWIGVIPLVTAAIGSCPLYKVLGIQTCPIKK